MVNESDKKIRISLTVREGKNFNCSPGTYFLEATLNGHKTTSEPIFAEHSWPLFNTEFTWRVDRMEFNFLKDNNRPLRIECFTVDGWRRRRLGFVLLQLSAAIPTSLGPVNAADRIPGHTIDVPGAGEDLLAGDFRWVRLFGLDSGLRLLHPELAVRLTVTGNSIIQDTLLESLWEKAPPIQATPPPRRIFTCSSGRGVWGVELKPKQRSEQLYSGRSKSILSALQCFRRTESILCLEGIDSGDAKGRVSPQSDNYTIGFLIQCAYNLELLTSQDTSYSMGTNASSRLMSTSTLYQSGRPQTAYEPYNLTLTFLELTVNTKYFPKACHQVVLNDKIVFKVRSSNECLTAFLNRFSKAKLRLWRGRKLLGTADLDLADFNITKFFSESAMLRGRYERDVELTHPDSGRVPKSKGGKTPFVTVTTFLRREPYVACESNVNYLGFRSSRTYQKPSLRRIPHNYCSSVRTRVESQKSRIKPKKRARA